MIFEIMLVHGLAVKPPPSPCQVSNRNVSNETCLIANVRKQQGDRSKAQKRDTFIDWSFITVRL